MTTRKTTRKPAAKKRKKTGAKPKANTNPAVHTVPHGKGWANKRAGASKVSKVFPTKAAAQKAGRATAMREKTEHVIHTSDGKMGARNSYGSDPRGRG